MSSENPTPSPSADPYLLNEQAIREYLDTIGSDDDVSSVNSVCSNCKHHAAQKGEGLKRCSRCHITRYCSVQCQRKDLDFHRFACAVVAKKSDTVKTCNITSKANRILNLLRRHLYGCNQGVKERAFTSLVQPQQ